MGTELFYLECTKEFKTREEALQEADKQTEFKKIELHIHKHDDVNGNEPCEIEVLKDEL